MAINLLQTLREIVLIGCNINVKILKSIKKNTQKKAIKTLIFGLMRKIFN